jgi:hypothetical protein
MFHWNWFGTGYRKGGLNCISKERLRSKNSRFTAHAFTGEVRQPSAANEVHDQIRDMTLLIGLKAGEHGQGNHFGRDPLRHRKISVLVA